MFIQTPITFAICSLLFTQCVTSQGICQRPGTKATYLFSLNDEGSAAGLQELTNLQINKQASLNSNWNIGVRDSTFLKILLGNF